MMSLLWRRTLVRRVSLSLLAAFALAYGVVLLFQFHEELQKDRDPAPLLAISADVQSQLAAVSAPDIARATGAMADRLLNGARTAPSPRGPILVQVWDRQAQRLVFSSREIGERPLPGRAGDVVLRTMEGQVWRIATQDTPRWSVRVGIRSLDRAWALGQLNDDLWPYVLLALPFVVVPMWFAVWQGLRPLRRLSGRIEKREMGDVAPLGIEARHAELKPLVAALERLMSQLRARIEGERAFVQDAAHELRTPMAVIAAQAHVLSMASSEQDKREARRTMQQAVSRASHLVGQLLELARMDRQHEATTRQLDMAHLARQLLAQAMPAALGKDMELSLDAPDVLHASFDVHAVHSVLGNLLDNAIRYGKRGGRVAVSVSCQARWIRITVADDGPGIPLEERTRVFERFYRGASSQGESGSGLGLAIVQRAVARLGGSMQLTQGLDGVGCCFAVNMPACPR